VTAASFAGRAADSSTAPPVKERACRALAVRLVPWSTHRLYLAEILTCRLSVTSHASRYSSLSFREFLFYFLGGNPATLSARKAPAIKDFHRADLLLFSLPSGGVLLRSRVAVVLADCSTAHGRLLEYSTAFQSTSMFHHVNPKISAPSDR
jgi:hypothetical protein